MDKLTLFGFGLLAGFIVGILVIIGIAMKHDAKGDGKK